MVGKFNIEKKEEKNKRVKEKGQEVFPRPAGSLADDTFPFIRQQENSYELCAMTVCNFLFHTPYNYLTSFCTPEDSLV